MNSDLCIQAYNDCIESVARLAAFCTASYVKKIGHGHYEKRATVLASRDTLLMCISLRRLAELTATKDALQREPIHAFLPKLKGARLEVADSGMSYSAWDVMGNVIHAQVFAIATDDADLKSWLSMTRDFDTLWDAMQNRRQIDALFLIKSDKGIKGFRAVQLIKAAVRYLDHVEDVLSDNSIYVGSFEA